MLFNITHTQDQKIEDVYDQSIKKLNKFFDLDWIENLPNLFIVTDRKALDSIYGPTELWVVAFADNSNNIYMLSAENYERDSIHKYNEKEYLRIIPHELSHLYFQTVTGGNLPVWLDEGIAVYMADQLYENPIPKVFSSFLDSVVTFSENDYAESGYAVKHLVDKYGKDKLIYLLNSLSRQAVTKDSFEQSFESVYDKKPTYEFFNSFMK